MSWNRHTRFAPAPYDTTIAGLPVEMQTSPWIFLRSHAFPKQDRREYEAAIADPASRAISRDTLFVSQSAWCHPYSHVAGGMSALAEARQQLARMQQAAVANHYAQMPLSRAALRASIAAIAPVSVSRPRWQATARAAARGAGAPALTARQLPAYVVNYMPPAVLKAQAALQQPLTRVVNEDSIISRQRQVGALLSRQVRGVVKGAL